MKTLSGNAASSGIVAGQIFVFRHPQLVFEDKSAGTPQQEWQRMERALSTTRQDLLQIYDRARLEAGPEGAEIFKAHLMILDDPEFTGAIREHLDREKSTAETALTQVTNFYVDLLGNVESDYIAERTLDIKDVSNRILQSLLGVQESPTANLTTPSVILADDFTPSDTIQIDKRLVLGFCTARGGTTSHTAILARSLGIPAVTGLGDEILALADGQQVIIDGNEGLVVIDPDPETMAQYESRSRDLQSTHDELARHASEPATTRDGVHFEVCANIGNAGDAKNALENGAEGVGLLRTEFLYLERDNLPDEEEQYTFYRRILDEFDQLPVTLRTLDIGGDKELPYLKLEPELNPFLGLRAIRLCLAQPELIKPQIRAALRAGVDRNLRLMFPMVTTLNEVQQARRIFDDCRKELIAAGQPVPERVEIGIMIETPAASIMADHLAKQVDFFSIGTNDLSQYTFAADRTNPHVVGLLSGVQPSILRLVRDIIKAAHAQGKWVAMCGELAGSPLAVPILVGLGLDEFSVNPPAIPLVKHVIRNLTAAEMKVLARECLRLGTAEEVEALVHHRVPIIKDL